MTPTLPHFYVGGPGGPWARAARAAVAHAGADACGRCGLPPAHPIHLDPADTHAREQAIQLTARRARPRTAA